MSAESSSTTVTFVRRLAVNRTPRQPSELKPENRAQWGLQVVTSIESGSGRVPGVEGYRAWVVQVTKNASGTTVTRMLQSARIDNAPIGPDDSRWAFIAGHARAV